MSGLQLFTLNYQRFEAAMGVPVRISNGAPRWRLRYELRHVCRELIPLWVDVRASLPAEVFEERYRARLEGAGVDAIRARLSEIAQTEGDPRLVLMCFEDLAKPDLVCHRRSFANWWLERTGEPVRELGPTGSQQV